MHAVSYDQVEWHKIRLLAYVEILIPSHNNFLSYRRIRRDVNRNRITETTISGYWYRIATKQAKDWGLSGVMLRAVSFPVPHPKHSASLPVLRKNPLTSPFFIDPREKETSTSWEARHQVSGLMRITKRHAGVGLLAQEGGALPHRSGRAVAFVVVPGFQSASRSNELAGDHRVPFLSEWSAAILSIELARSYRRVEALKEKDRKTRRHRNHGTPISKGKT
ncbi:hypothetical protein DH2020_048807 [Rehmannia glutinosa]|uniref:Uncharacterized protein n=1 Tax=Rehmannia glutinosa TaxID=99300 RepID=A0ABR0U5C1_REHGL